MSRSPRILIPADWPGLDDATNPLGDAWVHLALAYLGNTSRLSLKDVVVATLRAAEPPENEPTVHGWPPPSVPVAASELVDQLNEPNPPSVFAATEGWLDTSAVVVLRHNGFFDNMTAEEGFAALDRWHHLAMASRIHGGHPWTVHEILHMRDLGITGPVVADLFRSTGLGMPWVLKSWLPAGHTIEQLGWMVATGPTRDEMERVLRMSPASSVAARVLDGYRLMGALASP